MRKRPSAAANARMRRSGGRGYSAYMTAVEGLPSPPLSVDPESRRARPGALPALCPYLATTDGTWRSASADRDHRCMAVNPPVPLAPEKQRRLCLVDAHVGCATYGAALASHPGVEWTALQNRPVARMTPVILDRGRFDLRLPPIRADRAAGQAVLVAVLGVALAAIVIARPGGDAGPATALGSASPTTDAAEPSTVAAVPPAVESAVPTEAATTNAPGPAATTTPAASPAASAPGAEPVTSGATYKVKSGDTLSTIAARFDTTVRVLVDLNGIADPSRLRIGQILELP